MNDNNIPIVEPTVDYTKIPPIQQKRTISFINHFIVTTVSFLNKFSLNCDDKLYEFENKLQKLEAAVVILESRLASVPGLKNNINVINNCNDELTDKIVIDNNKVETTDETNDVTIITDDKPINNDVVTINKHPLYEKYFKMMNFGVLKPAVKLKMSQDGIDPSLLDDPQQLIPIISSNTVEG